MKRTARLSAPFYASLVAATCLGLPALGAELWECSLDLHQGDRGRLTFKKAADGRIEGTTFVQRNSPTGPTFTHEISGNWEKESIRFRRILSPATTYQDFRGVAIQISGSEYRMAGRFAARYSGVWSADCELTGSSPSRGEAAVDTQAPKVQVDFDGILSVTLGDRVRIRAAAEDDTAVAETSIFIDGRAVQTCRGSNCRYEGKPSVGRHSFYAQARDRAGNVGRSETLQFMVHPSTKPGPSLNTRTDPYQPTSRDRVTFIARGSHSSGVRDITIHVNGRAVKTCRSQDCRYTGGPYAAGQVTWRVSARSRDGGETYGSEVKLAVKAAPTTGACSISGRALGRRADASGIFFVSLFGPDDDRHSRGSARFTGGRYRFDNLPEGNYRLVVDTRADTAVGVNPRQRRVRCSGRGPTNINFEFR